MIVAGGIVAAATAAFGPGGAIAGAMLTPAAELLVERAAAEWRAEGQRRTGLALSHAATASETSVEQFLERCIENPTRLALLAAAVEAATAADLDAKLRMLGSALASGVLANDDALVDEAQLRVNVIRELDAPHIKVLAAIDRASGHSQGNWTGASEASLTLVVGDGSGARSSGVLQPILRTLDRNGLIHLTGIGEIWDEHQADDYRPGAGSNEWTTTIFGRELLSEYRAAGGEAEAV
jgi:hypothetical protein